LIKVEVVRTSYLVGPLIVPFNSLLISMVKARRPGPMAELWSTIIPYEMPYIALMDICPGASSLQGMDLDKMSLAGDTSAAGLPSSQVYLKYDSDIEP